jgi:cytochrome c
MTIMHGSDFFMGVSMKFLLTASLCGAVLVAPAYAADVAAGHAIAQRWCANCHVTSEAQRGQDTAPTLPYIAERHASDKAWLRAWLTSPHPPMPNFNLSRQEIDDVIAYLATLAPAQPPAQPK